MAPVPYAAFSVRATTYLPLALLAVLLTVLLVKAVGMWQEIHEAQEPITTSDLLDTFEQAHADGELDDDEFARVREQLASCPTGDPESASCSRPPQNETAAERIGPSSDGLDDPSHSSAEHGIVNEE